MNRIAIQLCLIVSVVMAASAQPGVPASIRHIEGNVYLDGKRVEAPAVLGKNSVVETEEGRAEIVLSNGSVFLGENSSMRIAENRPYTLPRAEILNGSALLKTLEGSGLVNCEGAITLSSAGLFQFDLRAIPGSQYGEHNCRFRVHEGAAAVQLVTYTAVLTPGKMMNLNRRCGDMIPMSKFDTGATDALHRWSQQRSAK
jgi:hypothetical protein